MDAERIAELRDNPPWNHERRCMEIGASNFRELLDAAEQNERLRVSWCLRPTDKVIESKENELLIETETGDRRRINLIDSQLYEENERLRELLRESQVYADHLVGCHKTLSTCVCGLNEWRKQVEEAVK